MGERPIIDIRPTQDWAVEYGLEGDDVATLLTGVSERLAAAGLPLWRTHLSFPTLDPAKRSENIVWLRDTGATREVLGHEEFDAAYEHSPFPEMLKTNRLLGRWRLEQPGSVAGYPVMEAMQRNGGTDLLLRLLAFGGHVGALLGTAISAATDKPGGFSPAEIEALTAVTPAVGLAAYRILLADVMGSVLRAYIGHDAGGHVLGGQIRPGEGHRVTGALMFADLRGFTSATEREGAGVIGRLGEHLAAMAEPVEAAGGEVLKFLGDGLLAAFPVMSSEGAACDSALDAALDALARNAAVNDRHPGTPRLDLDIALHLGEVFYGNIGAASRLEFTVIGPAVNEASRLEALCGTLDQAILTSEPFARHCSRPLTPLGQFDLRGVSGKRAVFAPVRPEGFRER
ncbi:adenylate/guanylate cyclase domain-containing protein [Enterovirga rhinocerotis]|uniref:Adenylate cyclase n=1 Tax=Enterovirga rhinocerotis TaxID=1339210 RepID=A0A4R7C8J0_9HYPH|nr:adenylate/guanylate cyclase domain-containing protein [Enterovirga rhinocerotis]TDR94950.1 adenylate cyclase [Enterovirga rhinocerotis]